jgi:hypothetical protein
MHGSTVLAFFVAVFVMTEPKTAASAGAAVETKASVGVAAATVEAKAEVPT